MLSTYWSLSQHGQLQPHSKSKAWKLSTQLQNGLFKNHSEKSVDWVTNWNLLIWTGLERLFFCDNCFCSWTSTLWQQEVDLAYFSGQGYLLLDLSQPVPIQDLFVTEKVSLCSQVEQKGRTDGLLFSPFSTWSPLLAILNHFLPNISMNILHTTPQTFPRVLTRRICSTIKSFFSWWSSPLFSWP